MRTDNQSVNIPGSEDDYYERKRGRVKNTDEDWLFRDFSDKLFS